MTVLDAGDLVCYKYRKGSIGIVVDTSQEHNETICEIFWLTCHDELYKYFYISGLELL